MSVQSFAFNLYTRIIAEACTASESRLQALAQSFELYRKYMALSWQRACQFELARAFASL